MTTTVKMSGQILDVGRSGDGQDTCFKAYRGRDPGPWNPIEEATRVCMRQMLSKHVKRHTKYTTFMMGFLD